MNTSYLLIVTLFVALGANGAKWTKSAFLLSLKLSSFVTLIALIFAAFKPVEHPTEIEIAVLCRNLTLVLNTRGTSLR